MGGPLRTCAAASAGRGAGRPNHPRYWFVTVTAPVELNVPGMTVLDDGEAEIKPEPLIPINPLSVGGGTNPAVVPPVLLDVVLYCN